MKLLDWGCGLGAIAIGFAKIITPGKVTGIDIGSSQISIAVGQKGWFLYLRFLVAYTFAKFRQKVAQARITLTPPITQSLLHLSN